MMSGKPSAIHTLECGPWTAYPRRRPLIPWAERDAVPEAEVYDTWAEMMNRPPTAATHPRLLYIHVPFCANHCLFCGFYKNKLRKADIDVYVDHLIEELEAGLEYRRHVGAPIHAVYLGGGTPSAMQAKDMHRVITYLKENYPLAADCEITMEGRILHFDDERVDACVEAGVNRVSIGVQSFNTRVRQQQGRRADRETAIKFIENLRDRSTLTVVLDLIFGLPHQTPEIWYDDVRTTMALEPDGVDFYALNIFPGTPLFTAVQRGQVPMGELLSSQASMYDQAVKIAESEGWIQVSNSHFARNTRERNRYNLLIKEGAETLAFGSGAGGGLDEYSYNIESELAPWTETVLAGKKPVAKMFKADKYEPVRVAITGDIEKGRLRMSRVRSAFEAIDEWPEGEVSALLERWADIGLVEQTDWGAKLTNPGRFWGTNMRGELLDLLLPAPAVPKKFPPGMPPEIAAALAKQQGASNVKPGK